jgi:hypothetical protein
MNYVCRLKKAPYGLKQAPKAWYARLDRYLQQEGFCRGNVDIYLYFKLDQGHLIVLEVYVDDIIFRSDDNTLS